MTNRLDKNVEERASAFIVSTCQLLPQSSSLTHDYMHDLLPSTYPAPKRYQIFCGSSAEFYIRPLNKCITDTDYLTCKANQLAFSGDFPVLPSDMSGLADTIDCYKIEPNPKYPGFVRLRDSGKLNYNWKYKKYTYTEAKTKRFVSLDIISTRSPVIIHSLQTVIEKPLPSTVCGPAVKSQDKRSISCDTVQSIFCPKWPLEAQDWPLRPRKYKWPTNDKISEVLQNGCHVVYVQHRSCRDNKWQWRLSFSLAEVILIRSLSQVQQIVYHLLRFFAKNELILKDCSKEDEVICPYHLKTLMLWTCEEMSSEWWNPSSVIAICCELLKKLSEWLQGRKFPNYFIPEANLFHMPSNLSILHQTERRLSKFHNSEILSHWFVENYILPITQTQFRFLSTGKKFPDFIDYLLPLVDFRKAFKSFSFNHLLCIKFYSSNLLNRCAAAYGVNAGLRQSLRYAQHETNFDLEHHSEMIYHPTTDKCLCVKYQDLVVYILHVAYGLRHGKISWDSSLFVEFVSAISSEPNIIRSQHHNFPKLYIYVYAAQSSRFQFLRALGLMKNLTGSNSRSEFRLLSLMAKEFLRKSLKCDDYELEGIAPVAMAYLAALHFATLEYKQAMHFCSKVLVDQTPHKDEESLNAGCLLFIDDVAKLVGFFVLLKKVTSNLCYIGRRLYLDLRLSPDVFAQYLTALSADRLSKHFDFNPDLQNSTYAIDEYFKALTKPRCIAAVECSSHFNAKRSILYRRTNSLAEAITVNMNPTIVKETVVDCLMEMALENMTSFCNVIRKDFGFNCNTIDCYRALYFYKCRKYNEVLRLCEQILHGADLMNDLREFVFANVLLLPPLNSFFDEDIHSLFGYHTLVFSLSPSNDKVFAFQHWFQYNWILHRTDLAEGELRAPPVKCDYVLGRHFLARYLRVRCCIDCNLPHKVALNEFAAQKIRHPFENIIRRFLMRKF